MKQTAYALLALTLYVLACGNSGEREPDEYDALAMSQQLMSERLKAPATAEFAGHGDSEIVKLDSVRYRVQSYVDAENSFGATMRTHYTMELRHVGDFKWIVENIITD